MIALAWLFLVAAIATLAIGFFGGEVWVIFVSIGSSALALLFLLGSVLRRKPVQPATAGAPYGPPVGEASAAPAAATAVSSAPAAPAAPAAQRRPATPSAPSAPAAKPATRKPAAKKAAAKTTTRKKATSTSPASKTTAKKSGAKKTAAAGSTSRAMVVAIPERGTYHESGCRYVQGRTDTERLQKKTAQGRGFKACGVCKP